MRRKFITWVFKHDSLSAILGKFKFFQKMVVDEVRVMLEERFANRLND